ncbi:uncharacterized protein MEPE_03811 [Melanopsichium pennsylvanicum]|uniref:STEEP1 domain-containing protein n=1 Tax=Melanopsichium pennsylvanicum TaxID=63383 RepID=A0AAJ4XMQ5_9BASI|nr:uncharacterized protein MEPE_03811 [Melanopsichium pennsylvanicum]
MRKTDRTRRGSNHTNTSLNVYYCLCGEFALVLDRALSKLPLRPLDHSRILRCLDSPPYSITGSPQNIRKRRVFKMSASQAQPKFIKRPNGSIEKRYPFHCSRCNLELGYEHTPPPIKSGGKFTFLLPGAVTDRQGVPPTDAFLQHFLSSNHNNIHDEQGMLNQGDEKGDAASDSEPGAVTIT